MDEENQNQQGRPDDIGTTMGQSLETAKKAKDATKQVINTSGNAVNTAKKVGSTAKNVAQQITGVDKNVVKQLANEANANNRENPNTPFGKGDNKKTIKGANSGGKKPGKLVGLANKGKASLYKAKGDALKTKGAAKMGLGAGQIGAGAGMTATGAGLMGLGSLISAIPYVGAPIGKALTSAGQNAMKAGRNAQKAGTKNLKQGKEDIAKGDEQKKRGEILESTGQDIGGSANDALDGSSEIAPKIPGIKSLKTALIEATKEIKKKVMKILIIALIIIILLVFFVLLYFTYKSNVAAYNEGDLSNVPYVVSSEIMDNMVIVKNSSGNYQYLFDIDGEYYNLSGAVGKALEILEENDCTALNYLGSTTAGRIEFLTQMVQAEIDSTFPDISNCEDLGYDSVEVVDDITYASVYDVQSEVITYSKGGSNDAQGGIKVVNEDGEELIYTSPENFNALVSANDESALNYYTLQMSSTSSSSTSGTSDFSGSTNIEICWNFFISKGLSEVCTAAIIGNLLSEGLDPDSSTQAVEEISGGGGYGIAQWTNDRRTQLENYASAMGQDVSSLELQLEFLWLEIDPSADRGTYASLQWGGGSGSHYYGWGREEELYNEFISYTSIEEATYLYCWAHERPREEDAHEDRRLTNAINTYSTYSGTVATSATTISSASSTSTTSATYKIIVANETTVSTTVSTTYEYTQTHYIYSNSSEYVTLDEPYNSAIPTDSEGETVTQTTINTKTIDYQSALKEYATYFDFLWAILVVSEDSDIVENLIRLNGCDPNVATAFTVSDKLDNVVDDATTTGLVNKGLQGIKGLVNKYIGSDNFIYNGLTFIQNHDDILEMVGEYLSDTRDNITDALTDTIVITVYRETETTVPTTSSDEYEYTVNSGTLGTSGLIAANDSYNQKITTTSTTTKVVSEPAITKVSTWIMNYSNNAESYEDWKDGEDEEITDMVNNVLVALMCGEYESSYLNLIWSQDVVIEALESSPKASTSAEYFEYIVQSSLVEESDIVEDLEMDISSFDLNTFKATSSTSSSGNIELGEMNGTFLEIAEQCHEFVRVNGFTYDDNYDDRYVPVTTSVSEIDCSTYVCWALYEYGYTELAGWALSCSGYDLIPWCRENLETVWSGFTHNITDVSEIQPGDIVIIGYDGTSDYGTHTQIFAGYNANGVAIWYNCGTDESIAEEEGRNCYNTYNYKRAGYTYVFRVPSN